MGSQFASSVVFAKLREVLALKGEALSTLGRYDEAIQLFDEVLAIDPNDRDTLNARGIARAALGRLAAGSHVNLEIDLIARYVERMLGDTRNNISQKP